MRRYIPRSKHIRPEVWKRITSVIRDYQALVDELKGISDAGHNAVRTTELQRKILAFNAVWDRTDDNERAIIRMKFMEDKTYCDMEAWVPMSTSAMKRAVASFVRELGQELGEID